MEWPPLIILFVAFCSILGRWGPENDRSVWIILAVSAGFALLYGSIATDQWLVFLAAFFEFATIAALRRWGWTELGKLQILMLWCMLTMHTCLSFDLGFGTSLVYDHYENTILVLNALQLTLGIDGFAQIYRRISERIRMVSNAAGSYGR